MANNKEAFNKGKEKASSLIKTELAKRGCFIDNSRSVK